MQIVNSCDFKKSLRFIKGGFILDVSVFEESDQLEVEPFLTELRNIIQTKKCFFLIIYSGGIPKENIIELFNQNGLLASILEANHTFLSSYSVKDDFFIITSLNALKTFIHFVIDRVALIHDMNIGILTKSSSMIPYLYRSFYYTSLEKLIIISLDAALEYEIRDYALCIYKHKDLVLKQHKAEEEARKKEAPEPVRPFDPIHPCPIKIDIQPLS